MFYLPKASVLRVLSLFFVLSILGLGLAVGAGSASASEALNFGVIIQTFASPDARPSDLAFDGEHLWVVTDGAVPTLWKLDPSDGSVVDSMPAPTAAATLGLEHVGTSLWGSTDDPDELYEASPVDGSVLGQLASPHTAPTGVAWDGADLWHAGTGAALHLIEDATGASLRTLGAPGQAAPRGMAWDGTMLWVVDATGGFDDAIFQLDPIDGTEKIQFVPQGDSLGMMSGLTYDGKYLWMSDLVDGEIHKVELGLHVDVWTQGNCPGLTQLRVRGETPSGRYGVAVGESLGAFEIPVGDCAGIPMEIDSIVKYLEITTDESAEFFLSGTSDAAFCGDYIQVIDLDTCLKSYVARVPLE